MLDFTSPTPPASPGIRPCDTILKGFGYSQPVLDFTDDPPTSAIDRTITTTDLVLGEDQQDRSVSRSPGQVDHSPSPSTASSSSDNASSHLDRFSGSESELDESRYQTPPSHQQKRPSPPPAPRKRHTHRELHIESEYGLASDEDLEDPNFGDPFKSPPLRVVLRLDSSLLLPAEASPEEEQGGTEEDVMRPISSGPGPGLGNSVFRNSFRARQEQSHESEPRPRVTSLDRNVDREEPDAGQVPGFQAASNGSLLQEDLFHEAAHSHDIDFGQPENEIGHEGEEPVPGQDIRKRPVNPQNRPEKVWPAEEAEEVSATSLIASSNARIPCEHGCSRKFRYRYDRGYHHRHVHGVDMFKCERDGCNKEFLYHEERKTHMADHSPLKGKKRKSPPSVTTDLRSQPGRSEPREEASNQTVREPLQEKPDDVVENTQRLPAPGCSREGPTPSLTEGNVWTCVFPGCGSHHCQGPNLEQHYRLKHNVRLYGCDNSECDENFTHQWMQKEHTKMCIRAGRQADEAVTSVDEASQSPFNFFQPPSGFPDLRLMASPEVEQISDTLDLWTSRLDKERRHQRPPESSFGATGQSEVTEKRLVVYSLPESSMSSSLPSVGKLFSKRKITARDGEAMNGSRGKSKVPDLPVSNILNPAPYESGGGYSPKLHRDSEPGEFDVSMFGRKRKRLEDRISDGNEAETMRDDDYDSDEELKFPSMKRKRLTNKRAMEKLKEE